MALPSPEPLVLRGVRKGFGKLVVLDNLSFTLNPGQLTLLLGRNAAGKSTLLRIAAGLLRPDTGSVSLERSGPIQSSSIGYSGHQHMLYSSLSIEENLRLQNSLRSSNENVSQLLSSWELSKHAHAPVGSLSKGLQSRAALAATFMSHPKYILLDEPTSSLDIASVALLLSTLREHLSQLNSCVLIATHDLHALGENADRITILDRGRITIDAVDDRAAAIDEYRRINR